MIVLECVVAWDWDSVRWFRSNRRMAGTTCLPVRVWPPSDFQGLVLPNTRFFSYFSHFGQATGYSSWYTCLFYSQDAIDLGFCFFFFKLHSCDFCWCCFNIRSFYVAPGWPGCHGSLPLYPKRERKKKVKMLLIDMGKLSSSAHGWSSIYLPVVITVVETLPQRSI